MKFLLPLLLLLAIGATHAETQTSCDVASIGAATQSACAQAQLDCESNAECLSSLGLLLSEAQRCGCDSECEKVIEEANLVSAKCNENDLLEIQEDEDDEDDDDDEDDELLEEDEDDEDDDVDDDLEGLDAKKSAKKKGKKADDKKKKSADKKKKKGKKGKKSGKKKKGKKNKKASKKLRKKLRKIKKMLKKCRRKGNKPGKKGNKGTKKSAKKCVSCCVKAVMMTVVPEAVDVDAVAPADLASREAAFASALSEKVKERFGELSGAGFLEEAPIEKEHQLHMSLMQTAQDVDEIEFEDEEEEDEDIDALIEDLESQDAAIDEEEEDNAPGGARVIPEELLQTDTRLGLTAAEVLSRRKKYGLNQMKEEKENLILKFLSYFIGPIQFVMEAAAVLAAGLQDWVDFGVICGLLLLNAAVGFVQEFQAGSIVEELKKTLALKATVLRDGALTEIEAPEVVPGDILQVEEGTIIPADGRIVTEDAFLQVDQSAITGESLAVDKHKGDVCYASSAVKRGEAFIVITATGDSTFVGRAASLVASASSGTGHFTEVLNGIGTVLLILVILTLLVVWVSSFYRSNGIVTILEFTLAITIIGVPVGLPAVVTTTMAVGAAYLAKKQAIVQKLSAIESLAGVEILCSDKTGTLTKNKLSLAEPYTVAGVEPEDLMLTACLAASRKKKGIDAIDKAFLKALKYYPRAKSVLSKYKVIDFHPFDPVSKKVQAVVESPKGERIICVKGAPLFVLKTVEEDHPIPEAVDEAYKNKVAEFATRGFRSLGVARKRGDSSWEILGIMPCSDPPRHDTARTINEAKTLGLSIKMLTGDAVGIARETSRQLGLGTNVYNAERLGLGGGGEMPGSEVYDFVEAADGFAEVFPQHKYNVVEILQQRGYLVAMTGDGVNDAPSLKKADTGIAVEGASDAARSAADIVFLAPGLGAIIDALKTSRQIFHRMYAYVVYRIALSLHLEFFLGLWIAILNTSLNLELVVFIAIFADIATLAIAYDNAPFSKSPVKWNLPKLWGMSVLLGVILAVGTWITLTTMFPYQNLPNHDGQRVNGGIVQNFGVRDEVLFLQISLSENWLIFITRANGPFWSSIPSWQLSGAILVVDIIATLFCIFGWFVGGQTSIVAVVRVWIFSFGVFCVMGGVYYLLQDSVGFDNLMHGKSPKKDQKQRSLEDFVVSLQRVSTQHEKSA